MSRTTKIMTRTKATVALAATLMSTTLISSAALAGDAKVYPGNMCQYFLGTDAQKLNYSGGAVFNNSNSTVEVRCPIVRDVTQGTENGGNGPFADIQVQRFSSGSGAIECELRTYKINGNFEAQSNKVRFSGVGETALNIPFVRQSSGGAYEIACTLPPSAAVERYTVTE